MAIALAKLDRTTKTEAVRRALVQTLAERRRDVKRRDFKEFVEGFVADARRQPVKPVTKQELDNLWAPNDKYRTDYVLSTAVTYG